MADIPISGMAVASQVNNADLIPIVQGGMNFSATRQLILKGGPTEDIVVSSSASHIAELDTYSGNAGFSVNDANGQAAGFGDELLLNFANTSLKIQASPLHNFEVQLPAGGDAYISGPSGHTYILVNDNAGQVSIGGLSGVSIQYFPAVSANWNPATGVPGTDNQGIERCAALLKILNGGIGP